MSILDIIALIAKFGGSIPLILAFLEAVATAWKTLQDGIAAATGKVAKLGAAAAVTLTPQELEACHSLHAAHLKAVPGQPVSAFDGHRIIALMQFLKANPELLSNIASLLPILLALFGKAA